MKQLFYILTLLLTLSTSTGYSQGLLPSNSVNISINISDTVINNTIIKRKADLFTMVYNIDAKFLSLTWKVKHYSDSLVINNGHDTSYYGQYLGGLIPDKIKETIADNNSFVNANTGDFVFPDEQGNFPTNIPVMGQYDYFNYVAEHVPIIVNDLIRYHGAHSNFNTNLK